MSTNCLVTKLKGVVNNEQLPELGIIKIPVQSTNGQKGLFTRLGGHSTENGIIVSIEDGSLYNYNSSTSLGNETSAWNGSAQAREFIANSNTFVRIKNKYNLKALVLSKYNSSGILQTGYVEDFVFPINTLSNCAYLTHFGGLCDFIGDLNVALKSCSSLDYLLISRGKVTGEIKNLVLSLIQNSGQTTGTINEFSVVPTATPLYSKDDVNITFNGTKLDTLAQSKLTWESNSRIYITVGGNWKRIYCIGYTDAEIQTNTSAGGIWEGYSVTKYD